MKPTTTRRAAATPAILRQLACIICDIQTHERRITDDPAQADVWRRLVAELRAKHPAAAAWLDSREVKG